MTEAENFATVSKLQRRLPCVAYLDVNVTIIVSLAQNAERRILNAHHEHFGTPAVIGGCVVI